MSTYFIFTRRTCKAYKGGRSNFHGQPLCQWPASSSSSPPTLELLMMLFVCSVLVDDWLHMWCAKWPLVATVIYRNTGPNGPKLSLCVFRAAKDRTDLCCSEEQEPRVLRWRAPQEKTYQPNTMSQICGACSLLFLSYFSVFPHA
jgi:hypothetical protein